MIKAIISDFDGTLVDTCEANLCAYQKAFHESGFELTAEKYRKCFGLRFDSFMQEMGINDRNVANAIKEAKMEYYPLYFNLLKPNTALIELISSFKSMGGKTAIASTARKENLMNVVEYLGIKDNFDLVFAGIDVKEGKPSPEIYVKAMEVFGAIPEETLIFEDSEVGIHAARASGAKVIAVPPTQFE